MVYDPNTMAAFQVLLLLVYTRLLPSLTSERPEGLAHETRLMLCVVLLGIQSKEKWRKFIGEVSVHISPKEETHG